MVAYRITTAKWASKLTGSGYPARWNPKGMSVVYTAGSRALACLENLAHRSGEGLNKNFRVVTIHIPETVTTDTIYADDLPDGWNTMQNYPSCQAIGSEWVNEGIFCTLKVPSSIIEDEFNILINPNHPQFEQISIRSIQEFSFDERLVTQ